MSLKHTQVVAVHCLQTAPRAFFCLTQRQHFKIQHVVYTLRFKCRSCRLLIHSLVLCIPGNNLAAAVAPSASEDFLVFSVEWMAAHYSRILVKGKQWRGLGS